jgi:CRISPR-associated endonuclease/helicase Cas3
MTSDPSFVLAFKALTDNHPFHWQIDLFNRFISDKVPFACDIPTGLGKTSVIPVWLVALAQSSVNGSSSLPRRLAYIVNRRTVVDQATKVVEQMRARLLDPDGVCWSAHSEILRALAKNLGDLAATKMIPPIGISTLRGELADNEEWKADPARPAVIIGTIDMIGSKLLFSGYGDGRYNRAHHAGLIGQDMLIVHDEAHLTPALSNLLLAIETEQRTAHERNADSELRHVRVLELSATQRRNEREAKPLTLTHEDETDIETGLIAKARLDAAKHLRLHSIGAADPVSKMIELAKSHENLRSRVLIYVRSPEGAQNVAKRLRKEVSDHAGERIALLTGTIRGHERDILVSENLVYRALLDHKSNIERTVYLVSTSAGEVGIDLDADHMVCDMTTLDSMIQRLGRVNRRGGEARSAHVDIVWTTMDEEPGDRATPVDTATAATLQILRNWCERSADQEVNVSPRDLHNRLAELNNEEQQKAFSPKGQSPLLSEILLDSWSLTSVDAMPSRPEVAAYLHGLSADPPETYIVWRKEVALLEKASVTSDSLEAWFRACRIEARERLRERTDRVKKTLGDLLKAHHQLQSGCDFPVVLLDERGRAQWSQLSKILEDEKQLRYRTAVLPVEAAGLDTHGMLSGDAVESIVQIDVADNDRRQRCLHICAAEGERYQLLLPNKPAAELPLKMHEQARIRLKEPAEGAEGTVEEISLLLILSSVESAAEGPENTPFRQSLTEHTQLVKLHSERIVDRLFLAPRLKEAVVLAAKWHDLGKNRIVWQRYACNRNGTEPLAKSTKYLHWHTLGGYRHEFGSLLEATFGFGEHGLPDEIAHHPERDLILHLIAAHHGWARPHFDPSAFDHEQFSTQINEQAAAELLQNFGRLQQRFGRWGLAWLESLLRCADITASKTKEDDEQ